MKKILSAFLSFFALAGCTPKSYSMKNNSQVVNFGNFQNNPKTQKMKKKKKKLKNNIPPISDKKDELGKNKIPPKLENNEGDEDFDATDLVLPGGLLALLYYMFSDKSESSVSDSGLFSKVGDFWGGAKNLVKNLSGPNLPLIKNHNFNKTHPIYKQSRNNCFFLSSLYTEYDPRHDKLYEEIAKKSTDEIIKKMDENSVKSYKSGQWKNLNPEQRTSVYNEAKGKWRGLNIVNDPGTMGLLQNKDQKAKDEFLEKRKAKSLKWKTKHAEGLKKMCEVFVRQKKLMNTNNNNDEKKFDVYPDDVFGNAEKMGEFEFSMSPSKNLDFNDKKNSNKNRNGGIGSFHKVLQDLNYFDSLIVNDGKTIFGQCAYPGNGYNVFNSLEDVKFSIFDFYAAKESFLNVGDDGKVTINGENYYLVSISQPDKGWGSEGHMICLQPKYTKSKNGYKISSVLRLGCSNDSHELYKTESLKDIILKWSHRDKCEWYFKLVHESVLDGYKDYYCYNPIVEKKVDKN